MSRKIRWIKPLDGLRHEGMVEENDTDLCQKWVDAGLAEFVKDDAKTHAEEVAEDIERRRQPVLSPDEKAVKESPIDRAMKPAAVKTKGKSR
jgi:hypothetical protein